MVVFPFLTSITDLHRHRWSPKKRLTSLTNGHTHRISPRKRIALRSNNAGHTHILFSTIPENYCVNEFTGLRRTL